jgi:hypothetical protein
MNKFLQNKKCPIGCSSNSSKFAKMKSSSLDEISIFSGSVTIKFPMPPDIFERIADEFCLSRYLNKFLQNKKCTKLKKKEDK